jgi:ABC-type branched-subunit amino acid transport system ATPase component
MVLIDALGLTPVMHTQAGALSYGQRKLLGIANALQPDSALVLLDEPAAGLSPILVDRFIELILAYNKDLAKSFVIVEHSMKVIAQLCDRVLVLSQGKGLTEGSPNEVQNDPRVIDAFLGGRHGHATLA